ncbi:MAG: OmpA family protein [Candidatus Marinimicrobia bacterium]|nr:OmpA family protein [Candidatus Neomarinimicrobiota bacterium]
MKVQKFIVRILLGMSLLLFMSCFGNNSELLQEKDKELDQLRAELEQLDKQLEDENKQVQRFKDELEKKNEDITQEILRSQAYKKEVEKLEKELRGTFVLSNRILLPNSVLFKSGSAELSERGQQFIAEIGETLSSHPHREILVEGHSDTVPISSKYRWKYTSNWELSSARALAVLHYLQDEGQIAPKRLGAVSYGEYHPITSNARSAGRAQNRRVEIVIGRPLK